HKFPAQQVTTKLEAIDVYVGRTGALTPVAHVTPVFVGGTTVRNATLHNIDEIRRKDLRVGDTVVLQRAGDVIPEVVGPVLDARDGAEWEWSMPERCPVCDTPAEREEGGVVWRCPNPWGNGRSVRSDASKAPRRRSSRPSPGSAAWWARRSPPTLPTSTPATRCDTSWRPGWSPRRLHRALWLPRSKAWVPWPARR